MSNVVSLSEALRFPSKGEGWFSWIFVLALVQLIPVVGQLILIGYGLEVVRRTYAGQSELPPIRLLPMLGDGLRVLVVGIIYLVPLLMVIPVIASVGMTQTDGSSGSSSNMAGVVITLVITLAVTAIVGRLKLNGKVRYLIGGVAAVVPVISVAGFISGIQASSATSSTVTAQLNSLGVVLFVLLGFLIFLIFLVLSVGSIRQAVTKRGLFAPNDTARWMWEHRAESRSLIGNVLVLIIIMIAAAAAGTVLLFIPGLFVLVYGSLSFWYLLANYSQRIGIRP